MNTIRRLILLFVFAILTSQSWGIVTLDGLVYSYDDGRKSYVKQVNTLGLSYFGARWYDPELGRFTGIDPVDVDENNPHSFNRYAYANNNPYKYVDPDGRAIIFALPVIVGAEVAFDTIFSPDVPFDSGVAQTSITLIPGPLKPLKGLSPVTKGGSWWFIESRAAT